VAMQMRNALAIEKILNSAHIRIKSLLSLINAEKREAPFELLKILGIKRVFNTSNSFILKATEIEDFQKLTDELAKKDIRVFF
jgi:hypothetical protein